MISSFPSEYDGSNCQRRPEIAWHTSSSLATIPLSPTKVRRMREAFAGSLCSDNVSLVVRLGKTTKTSLRHYVHSFSTGHSSPSSPSRAAALSHGPLLIIDVTEAHHASLPTTGHRARIDQENVPESMPERNRNPSSRIHPVPPLHPPAPALYTQPPHISASCASLNPKLINL
jgi:hypothetical protein